jgi:hypothetical protein
LSKAPCKDCVDRHQLCHSTCEKYLAFKKEAEELKQKIIEARRLEDDFLGVRSRHTRRKR